MNAANPVVVDKADDTKPGDANPGDAKPGDAKAADAKPGDAKPAKPGDKKTTSKNQKTPKKPDEQPAKEADDKKAKKGAAAAKTASVLVDIGDDGSLFSQAGPIASISPDVILNFPAAANHDADTTTIIKVTNLVDHPLSYKIRCKTPTAYLVRSSMGFIRAKQSVIIHVTLLKDGHHSGIRNDTFKVALTQISDKYFERFDKLDEIWRSSPKDPSKFMEITLFCNLDSAEAVGLKQSDPLNDPTLLKNFHIARKSRIPLIGQGLRRVDRLSVQLSVFIKCQLCLAVVVLICSATILYIYFVSDSLVRNNA